MWKNVFDIPLMYNPMVENEGKMLYLKPFVNTDKVKIKDLAFECKNGFLKDKYVQYIVF